MRPIGSYLNSLDYSEFIELLFKSNKDILRYLFNGRKSRKLRGYYRKVPEINISYR